MANNLIQIKRSSTTSIPASLSQGELAYTSNGDILYIGSPNGSIVAIGGARAPGVLTANQALVANATGYIDSVKTANLVPQKIYANGSHGTTGQVLAVDGGGNVYWVDTGTLSVTPAGSNQQIQFNSSNSLGASAGLTFNRDTYELYVGNTVSTNNLTIGNGLSANGSYGSAGQTLHTDGSKAYWANNAATVYGANQQIQFNDSGTLYANAGLAFNKDTYELHVGNSVSTAYITALNQARNITLNYNSTNSSVGVTGDLIVGTGVGGNISAPATATINIGTTTVNATNYTGTANNATHLDGVGASYYVNTSGSYTLTGNITLQGNLAANGIIANGSVGTAGQILTSNGSSVYWTSQTTVSNVAANSVQSNTITINDTITVGNSTVNVFVNSTSISLGSASVNVSINSTTFSGTANNASYLGGTIASSYATKTYADDKAANAYSNAMSDTLSRNGSYTGNNTFGGTNTIFSSNVALSGFVTTNIVPTSNNTLSLGTDTKRWSALYVSGNTIYIGNASISVDSSNTISFGGANAIIVNTATINTIAGTLTTVSSNLSVTSANIDATSALLRVRDATISGNLTINGTLTTVDTNNLKVKDSVIELADNNTATDTLDIGWYGLSGNASSTYYSGMVRKHDAAGAGLTSPVFQLFSTNTVPTGTVDQTALGFNQGTLLAYLNSSGLYTNSSVTNITANSTVSVALAANSLTLTTALAAVYGGTGQNTYSSGDLLVANTGNVLSKLTLSTTAGYILQSNGTALVYDSLDGGTF